MTGQICNTHAPNSPLEVQLEEIKGWLSRLKGSKSNFESDFNDAEGTRKNTRQAVQPLRSRMPMPSETLLSPLHDVRPTKESSESSRVSLNPLNFGLPSSPGPYPLPGRPRLRQTRHEPARMRIHLKIVASSPSSDQTQRVPRRTVPLALSSRHLLPPTSTLHGTKSQRTR
jgi:hypothetical protein